MVQCGANEVLVNQFIQHLTIVLGRRFSENFPHQFLGTNIAECNDVVADNGYDSINGLTLSCRADRQVPALSQNNERSKNSLWSGRNRIRNGTGTQPQEYKQSQKCSHTDLVFAGEAPSCISLDCRVPPRPPIFSL